jgi:hypothetical protein
MKNALSIFSKPSSYEASSEDDFEAMPAVGGAVEVRPLVER